MSRADPSAASSSRPSRSPISRLSRSWARATRADRAASSSRPSHSPTRRRPSPRTPPANRPARAPQAGATRGRRAGDRGVGWRRRREQDRRNAGDMSDDDLNERMKSAQRRAAQPKNLSARSARPSRRPFRQPAGAAAAPRPRQGARRDGAPARRAMPGGGRTAGPSSICRAEVSPTRWSRSARLNGRPTTGRLPSRRLYAGRQARRCRPAAPALLLSRSAAIGRHLARAGARASRAASRPTARRCAAASRWRRSSRAGPARAGSRLPFDDRLVVVRPPSARRNTRSSRIAAARASWTRSR